MFLLSTFDSSILYFWSFQISGLSHHSSNTKDHSIGFLNSFILLFFSVLIILVVVALST